MGGCPMRRSPNQAVRVGGQITEPKRSTTSTHFRLAKQARVQGSGFSSARAAAGKGPDVRSPASASGPGRDRRGEAVGHTPKLLQGCRCGQAAVHFKLSDRERGKIHRRRDGICKLIATMLGTWVGAGSVRGVVDHAIYSTASDRALLTYQQATKQARKYAPRWLGSSAGQEQEAIEPRTARPSNSHLAKVLGRGLRSGNTQEWRAERDKEMAIDSAKRRSRRTAVNLWI